MFWIQVDGTEGHYAQCNKSENERQLLGGFIQLCNMNKAGKVPALKAQRKRKKQP